MKAKEFLNKKTLTAVETVNNLIINLVIEKTVYGLKVDTSSIPSGTKLKRTTSFKIEDDILAVGTISVNLAETDMLGIFEQE
jgi:hypothetical protein